MKGRTNVLTGGVVLNANTASKEIKSGSVVAGDFVQYFTNLPYVNGNASARWCGNIGDYSIMYYPGSSSGAVQLWKDGELLSSYSDHTVSVACVNDDYIVFFSSRSCLIGTLDIINDELVLVDTIELSSDFSTDTIYTMAASSEKIVLRRLTNGDVVAVCDISGNGELSNANPSTVSTLRINYNTWVIFDGLDFYVLGNFQYIYKLSIDQNNAVTIYSTVSSPNVITGIVQANEGSVIGFNGSSIYKINLSTGNGVTILQYRYILTNIENGYFIATSSNGSSSTRLYLYEFDEENETAIELDTIQMPSNNNVSRNFLYSYINGDLAYVCTSGLGRLYLIDIVNEYIEPRTDKDYIIPFVQYGHPIGVAKEAGTAGDTIDVYVPTP